ncbi:glutaredoxin family protein [Aeoliella sp.]|uniref:glutaredoxin family protein n=1 Tax=Aeoliella sp. TaxID=2795800 RepID=UPI003CCBE989
MKFELYTRDGCHLCDDAHQLLRSRGVEPTLTDIDTRPDLLTKYNTCVPVVVVDGKVRFRGRIDPVLLDRLLQEANR